MNGYALVISPWSSPIPMPSSWLSVSPAIWWVSTSRGSMWTTVGSSCFRLAISLVTTLSSASSPYAGMVTPLLRRLILWPARPTLCMRVKTCRGLRYWMQRSTSPMSMPSCSVLVQTMALSSPALKSSSTLCLCSRLRLPWCTSMPLSRVFSL